MKKTYSITCEPEIMARIDNTAKSLGMTRSVYMVFLAQTIEGLLGSQDQRDTQIAEVVKAAQSVSTLGK